MAIYKKSSQNLESVYCIEFLNSSSAGPVCPTTATTNGVRSTGSVAAKRHAQHNRESDTRYDALVVQCQSYGQYYLIQIIGSVLPFAELDYNVSCIQ